MTKTVKRLLDSFSPDHYDLRFHLDSQKLAFTGEVTIHGTKRGRPSQRLTFHQNGLTITEATIHFRDKKNKVEIPVVRVNHHASLHEVRLHTDQQLYPGSYTITMKFSAPITKGMTGIYPSYFEHDGTERVMLATQFESHHAREAFPCIDEPAAKATFDLTLVHESSLVPLGNTPIRQQQSLDDTTTETTFETSPKMSSYLLAFVVGELHAISGTTKSGVAVNIWASIAQPQESFTFALDAAIRSIEFFEDYFNTPYPLPKADHVALPDFSSGAMENWGLITYREAVLLLYPDAISQSTKELIATVVAHETSHQWFGNLVTMQWWDDLWLNESFANMMEYACVDALYPDWNIWESFITAEALSALRRDATPGVQAVKTAVNHPDEISTLFDPSIVYAKGGRLLYMLKHYIGEEAWRTGLSAYFKKHAYGNTAGSDLWAALSTASGKDIAQFMNPWLERSGFPVLHVQQSDRELSIRQEHFLDDQAQADADRIWPIPLFTSNENLPVLFHERQTTIDTTKDLSLLFNRGAQGHYLVHYETTDHISALKQQVENSELSTVDRLYLLINANMLGRAGYASYEDALQLLEAYKTETSEAVWDIISLIVADTRRFIDHDKSIEKPLKELVGSLVRNEYDRLGWNESEDESPADKKLRGTILGLSLYAEQPDVMTHAADLFARYKTDTSVVSAELRGLVFASAVKRAVPDAIDYLLDLHKTSHSSDLKRDISGGLTATKDPAVASQLLTLITDEKIVKPQDADRWLIYLLRNRYTRDTAWQWMEHNWDWIVRTYKSDKSYDNFPRYAATACATREALTQYKAFFEPKLTETGLKRNILIGIEEITSRVAWLERDLTAVQSFFRAR